MFSTVFLNEFYFLLKYMYIYLRVRPILHVLRAVCRLVEFNLMTSAASGTVVIVY